MGRLETRAQREARQQRNLERSATELEKDVAVLPAFVRPIGRRMRKAAKYLRARGVDPAVKAGG